MNKNKVLLAGATGYLGRFVAKELIKRSNPTRIIVREGKKINLEGAPRWPYLHGCGLPGQQESAG